MKSPLLLCLTVLFSAALIRPGHAAHPSRRFASPRLFVLSQRRLLFDIPAGWRIVRRDPQENWRTSSYDFDIAPTRHAAPLQGSVGIEILMHSRVRAQRHGDLRGANYRTAGGLHGIEHAEALGPRERDWYLALPRRRTRSAVIVRVLCRNISVAQQQRLVQQVFRSVRVSPIGPARASADTNQRPPGQVIHDSVLRAGVGAGLPTFA